MALEIQAIANLAKDNNMGSVGGLIILLIIGLIIWRMAAVRKQRAAFRKFEQDFYEITQDIRSRLSAVERRLEQLSPTEAPEPKTEPPSAEIAPTTRAAIEKVQQRVAAAKRADEKRPVVSDRVAEGRIEDLETGEPKTSWVDEVVSAQKKELETPALGEPSKSEPSTQAPSAKPPRKWTSLKPPRPEVSGKPRPNLVDRISTQLRKATERAPGEPIDWEALIGGSWLNVIGIVVLVVGMVLFSQHSLTQFGPAGKIGTGLGVSLTLLSIGILLERVQRYRLLAWTLVGGGWALLYFTAYAARNIEASRVIEDPTFGLLLLCGVAVGIILHSLRYRSQLLTGIAYGLGFFAITISPLNNYTLIAAALLAASQIAVVRALPWHYLALIAIVGTYLNHWRWLWDGLSAFALGPLWGDPITATPNLIPTADFWVSQGVLLFYWLLFIVMLFVRGPSNRPQMIVHLTVSIANTIGMLGLSAWQIWALHGEALHYLTAPAIFAYGGAAAASRIIDRPSLYRFNSSVAVLLYAISLPLARKEFGFSADWFALYWAVGAVAIIYGGYVLRDLALRVEAYLLCGLACLSIFAVNLQAPFATTFEFEPALVGWDNPRWWIPLVVLGLFLGLSEWLQRTSGKLGILPFASQLSPVFGYAAALILAAFLWKITDLHFVGLSWLGAGFVFLEAGIRLPRLHTRFQGYLLLSFSLVVVLAVNLRIIPPQDWPPIEAVPALWRIIAPSVAVFVYVYWRAGLDRRQSRLSEVEEPIGHASSAVATALTAIFLWREIDHSVVALSWLALALFVFEAGKWLSQPLLRAQAYLLLFAAFLAILSINLYEIFPLGGPGIAHHWQIVGLAAAVFYYVTWRLLTTPTPGSYLGFERSIATVPSIGGTAILAILCWKQLDAVYVAPSWALLALALSEIGLVAKQAKIRLQGHVLSIAVFARLFMANFVAPGEAQIFLFGTELGLSHRLLTVVPIIALFYYWRSQELDLRATQTRMTPAMPMSLFYSYGAAILLLALVRFEFGRALAVIGMAPLALILLLAGRHFEDVHFRLQSYVLALLTFARCWATNAYLIGDFYGVPERVATIVPCILAFGLAAVAASRVREKSPSQQPGHSQGVLQFLESNASDMFALLAAALAAILAFYELPNNLVTIAWGMEGLFLVALGLFLARRSLRYYGLALLLASLLKLTIIDMSGADPVYRIISYLALGVILLLASLFYTRYRDVFEKYV